MLQRALMAEVAFASLMALAAPTDANKMNGWYTDGNDAAAYEAGVLGQAAPNGARALYLKATSDKRDAFGVISHWTDSQPYWGKRIRIAAQIRTDSVERFGGLWVRLS